MTKTLSVLLISIVLVCVACGPTQEQIAKEKATQDSIAQAALAPQDFKTFLQTFVSAVNENKNQESYIHKDLGVYVYNNPGAFCMASKSIKMEMMPVLKEVLISNIFDRLPKGSFCEGYPGEKDGFYYTETSKNEMPSYYDAATEGEKKVVLPSHLNYKKFVKVNIIKGEYYKLDLYFTCIDAAWYLIGQSFCDCSA